MFLKFYFLLKITISLFVVFPRFRSFFDFWQKLIQLVDFVATFSVQFVKFNSCHFFGAFDDLLDDVLHDVVVNGSIDILELFHLFFANFGLLELFTSWFYQLSQLFIKFGSSIK